MKWLTKDISKRANCDNQKVIEDILNIMTDIETIAAVNNWVNNSVTDLTNRIINFFFEQRYAIWIINVTIYFLTSKFLWPWVLFSSNSYTSTQFDVWMLQI